MRKSYLNYCISVLLVALTAMILVGCIGQPIREQVNPPIDDVVDWSGEITDREPEDMLWADKWGPINEAIESYTQKDYRQIASQWRLPDFKYRRDTRNGGEYWQTPKETIKRMKGDCDDLAIMLYYLYKYSPRKPNDVQVRATGGYVRKVDRGRMVQGYHMWVTFHWDGKIVQVVDPLFNYPMMVIPASATRKVANIRYWPLISFDRDTIYLHSNRGIIHGSKVKKERAIPPKNEVSR